jgi:2-hydroxychromene-2-carboxylate isomerase
VSVANPQFMFDFGSPNAFLSHEAIPAIEARTGAKFEYIPILLGGIFKATNNKSPAETLAGVKNKREFNALETDASSSALRSSPIPGIRSFRSAPCI